MVELVSKVYRCLHCNRRLNIDDVTGSVVVICPKCRMTNRLSS